MRTLIAVFTLFFFSFNASATPPVLSSTPRQTMFQIGNALFADIPNLIIIRCVATGGSNSTCTFKRDGAASGYTPSGSHRFCIFGETVYNAGAGSVTVNIGASTNDLGDNSTTTPTWSSSPIALGTVTNGTRGDFNVPHCIENGKFLSAISLSSYISVVGFEL